MHDDPQQDLDPGEQELLRSLASGPSLSGKLEDQIVGALKNRGLIAASSPFRWRRLVLAGAMAAGLWAAFALGIQYGRREANRAVQAETPRSHPPATGSPDRPQAGEPLPPEAMLTAFHMGQDNLLAYDPGGGTRDSLGILGKPFEP